jgi:hypothetical protein
MWRTTILIGALAATSNAMLNYGDMLARRTLTPAPPEPTSLVESHEELQKRMASNELEGYTSEFGTCKLPLTPHKVVIKKHIDSLLLQGHRCIAQEAQRGRLFRR